MYTVLVCDLQIRLFENRLRKIYIINPPVDSDSHKNVRTSLEKTSKEYCEISLLKSVDFLGSLWSDKYIKLLHQPGSCWSKLWFSSITCSINILKAVPVEDPYLIARSFVGQLFCILFLKLPNLSDTLIQLLPIFDQFSFRHSTINGRYLCSKRTIFLHKS